MLTIMVFAEGLETPIQVNTMSTVDITDCQQATLLAKFLVEACKFAQELIGVIPADNLDSYIEFMQPKIIMIKPMFYSDN